jgi:hypothetical protein
MLRDQIARRQRPQVGDPEIESLRRGPSLSDNLAFFHGDDPTEAKAFHLGRNSRVELVYEIVLGDDSARVAKIDVILRGTCLASVYAHVTNRNLDDLAVGHRKHVIARNRRRLTEVVALMIAGDYMGPYHEPVGANIDDIL